MGKRDLKEQNKDLEIHVVDLINKFDPSKTGKYTKFLTKILKNRIQVGKEGFVKNEIPLGDLSGFIRPYAANELEDIILRYLRDVYGYENMETLISFHIHTQENRITGKDINDYEDWDEVRKDVSLATLRQTQRLLEKEVQKVLETDTWVIVKPLTRESSLSYGAGTKWCTSSKSNPEYFYRYSRNGVLCYAINKIDGDKFGIYYDIEGREFSIWDAPDRRIDSVESTIPSELISKLYKLMKSEKRNYEYFSESEKTKCNYQEEKFSLVEAPPIPEPEPDIYVNEVVNAPLMTAPLVPVR